VCALFTPRVCRTTVDTLSCQRIFDLFLGKVKNNLNIRTVCCTKHVFVIYRWTSLPSATLFQQYVQHCVSISDSHNSAGRACTRPVLFTAHKVPTAHVLKICSHCVSFYMDAFFDLKIDCTIFLLIELRKRR
jgi:hypothetical protein